MNKYFLHRENEKSLELTGTILKVEAIFRREDSPLLSVVFKKYDRWEERFNNITEIEIEEKICAICKKEIKGDDYIESNYPLSVGEKYHRLCLKNGG